MKTFDLTVIRGEFAVWRLPADTPLPSVDAGTFLSVTRTEDELSIVSPSSAVSEGAKAEAGWCCLRVEGPLYFELTGVVAGLSAPLARAEIPIFVVSTYETDYLLVRTHDLERACSALREEGHIVAFQS